MNYLKKSALLSVAYKFFAHFLLSEILSAPDRELNAWASLKKTCQFRAEQEETRDLQLYKSKGNNIELKKKMLPSLFMEETQAEEALVAEKDKKASKGKTKRRQKRKNHSDDSNAIEDLKPEGNSAEYSESKTARWEDGSAGTESLDVCKEAKAKRRKKNKQNKGNIVGITEMKSDTQKSGQNKSVPFSRGEAASKQSTSKKLEINAELRMSDNRLESYGIAPNKFKRRKMKAKYRQMDN